MESREKQDLEKVDLRMETQEERKEREEREELESINHLMESDFNLYVAVYGEPVDSDCDEEEYGSLFDSPLAFVESDEGDSDYEPEGEDDF